VVVGGGMRRHWITGWLPVSYRRSRAERETLCGELRGGSSGRSRSAAALCQASRPGCAALVFCFREQLARCLVDRLRAQQHDEVSGAEGAYRLLDWAWRCWRCEAQSAGRFAQWLVALAGSRGDYAGAGGAGGGSSGRCQDLIRWFRRRVSQPS
jgi:hypothetical protein